MTGDDSIATSFALLHRPLGKIEPQSRFAHFRVGTVTTEASAGKNGLNVLIKIKTPGNLRSVARERRANCESHNKHTKVKACPKITNRLLGTATEMKMRAVNATQRSPVFRT
jgi:hypothetical protein